MDVIKVILMVVLSPVILVGIVCGFVWRALHAGWSVAGDILEALA